MLGRFGITGHVGRQSAADLILWDNDRDAHLLQDTYKGPGHLREKIIGAAAYKEPNSRVFRPPIRLGPKAFDKRSPSNMRNRGPFGKKRQGKSKMKPTAFRDLFTQESLKKAPPFEEDLPRQLCLPYTPDQTSGGSIALSGLK